MLNKIIRVNSQVLRIAPMSLPKRQNGIHINININPRDQAAPFAQMKYKKVGIQAPDSRLSTPSLG